DELRRLPFGWGILFNRNGRPILMKMTKWPDRKDAKQIQASAGRYSEAMQEELLSGEDILPSTPTTSDIESSDDPTVAVPVR
ncbi:MAG TPA: type IV secretion system protein VirD4, partial [Enteractinococcus sp.]